MNHSQRVLATAVLAFTGFTFSPAFGNVLTVAPTGANYAQIQAAVNAASDGDVILISGGAYSAVTINGKSLTLCKQGAGSVSIAGTTSVTNLTASQRVLLSGLNGYGPVTLSTTSDLGVGLMIANNAGNVRVEYCNFFGAIGWGDNGYGSYGGICCNMQQESIGRIGAVVRDNSQGVSFTACHLEGGRAANAYYGCVCGNSWAGGDGLRVVSTLASLYDSECTGGRGGNNGSTGGNGGMGCRTTSGSTQTGVFASGSSFRGGGGGDATDFLGPIIGGTGGNGLLVDSATGVHLMDNTYFPGPGGTANWGAYPPGPPGAMVSGGGSIFYDPNSRIKLTVDRFARAGSIVDVLIQGAPGQDMYLIVSRAPTFQILPSWRGTLLSQQGKGSVVVRVGRIPTSGVLQARYQVPPLPAGVTSSTVYVQAVRSDMAAGPKLAAGTAITLLH